MSDVRVLHSVVRYLGLTENWIAPQVFRVPGIKGRVLCDERANEGVFPAAVEDVVVDRAPRAWHWRLQGLLEHHRRRRGASADAMRRIRRWKPQVLHAHFGQRGWQMCAAAERLDVPLVTSFYGFDAWMEPHLNSEWIGRYRTLFSAGAAFLVEGPAMRERLVALGCPERKVRIHRLGVDIDDLPFGERSFSAPIAVAMVGRFVEKKGLVDGLRACAHARLRGLDVRVTIVGDAAPGDDAGEEIRTQLRRLSATRELAGRVTFTGFVSQEETAGILRAHSVFLCPSRHATSGDAEGGSPVVLTQAMAMGCYCIGTRHCDIPEVIVEGQTGALVDEGDVEALAGALCAVADKPADALAIVHAGRRHIEESFHLRTQLAALGQLYQSLLT